MNNIKIGICGDVCSECPRYIATQNNDTIELGKIVELWYRLGFRNIIVSAEELKCTGCSSDNACAYQINNCNHLSGKHNCGECDLFPCEKINAAFQKTEELKDICREKCTDLEYLKLGKAFLNKKQILTEINDNFRRTKKEKL
jgi:hypothetical protein